MLKVKKLDPKAVLPTVAHPGEDLAYDLHALENTMLEPGRVVRVRTGIAAQAYSSRGHLVHGTPLGLLIRDRSSMAAKGITTIGGVIDHGYTGEIMVLMTLVAPTCTYLEENGYIISAGDKIAQMIPIPILTGSVLEVSELEQSARGDKGFGSTGK